MGFKSFRFRLVLRIILITIAILGFLHFAGKPGYVFTSIEFGVFTLILVVELILFVEKGYRQVIQMLSSVKEKDYNISFSPAHKSYIFENLSSVLNSLVSSHKQVRIERELHYQFLNHIVDQLSSGIVCFDLQGQVTLSNRALRNTLGVKYIRNTSSFSAISPTFPLILHDLKAGEERLFSFVHKGELKRFFLSCSRIKLLDKDYILVSMQNMNTPIQEAENESYKRLIRVLTHEIMNSVTPILSLSQSMNDMFNYSRSSSTQGLSEQELEHVVAGYEAIALRSKSLMRFVTDFKSLSQLPKPNIASIPIELLFRNIRSLFAGTLSNKAIDFTLQVSPGASHITADQELIEQALINLIKNAIEALACGTQQPKLVVAADQVQGYSILSITDNGCGIAPTAFDQIFVPFFTTKQNGSGIGLSLSRQIAQLHGGTIVFRSVPNVATTFAIRIPHE
ncbi:MAG: HAMP domain-containing histidine kinase [Bacteroidales bacterium]|nr:HAMP domain-containing histidine kinase [Bacteroidales bacterium]MBN2748917.1 HAMP domain-containing histidine kinase [Bacteroidales bacterium]